MSERMSMKWVAVVAVLGAMSAYAQEEQPLDSNRPAATAVGIGAGWSFPQSILEPNVVSVRFRVGGIALEPSFTVGGSNGGEKTATTTSFPGLEPTTERTEDRASGMAYALGAALRFPLASRGTLDLVGIGGANVGYNTFTRDEDLQETEEVHRTTTTAFSTGLSWGLGIEWFLTDKLSLSADATNPLVSWSNTTVKGEQRQLVGGEPATLESGSGQSNVVWGLRFQPSARVLVHLYF